MGPNEKTDRLMPFGGWRVLELSSGIPAAYCGKLFADAGAEVVKVESSQGDPMRHWKPTGADGSDADAGTLFGFLAASKKSVVRGVEAEIASLFGGADLVLTDLTDGWSIEEIAARTSGDATVVVAITPFGMTGPYVDSQIAANEFILQAMCGSTWGRGWPETEPLYAGGRLGEWLAGTFAAVVAAATVRQARRGGGGAVVDFSIYEAMVIAMGLMTMAASVLGEDVPAASRSLELPSIVPTADGMVGFCTITAQQFQDFLVMIERPDLLDDADLASFPGRTRRRDEFLAMVQRWTETKTTAEIIDSAVAFRIPVAPIATPTTVLHIDHYAQRGVFVESEQGLIQPRVPYRSDAFVTRHPGAAPGLGADNGRVRWAAPQQNPADRPGQADLLPLSGVRVADFTAFWAGPLATAVLAGLGADVVKIEGVRRADGMRFAGGRPPDWDQWWEWGPTYLCNNANKRGVSLELSIPQGREAALRLIAGSDVVIENFSPRVMANFDLEWDVVRAANPRAVMVRMPAFGLDGPWRDRVGFAQTMEQATGMAWMTGFADGPPVIPRGVCDPIAGLHAAFTVVAGLEVRDRTGSGMQIEATMVESALNAVAEMALEFARNGIELHRDGNRGPGASPQGVYRCLGDDEWVALAVLDDAAWPRLAELIGQRGLAGDAALQAASGRRARADEIDKLIGDWAGRNTVDEAVRALRSCGVAAARVTSPEAVLDDEQLSARGFWESVEHPVAGTFRCVGLPFTLAGRRRRWVRTAAPLYGQHTEEVLTEVLGIGEDDFLALRQAGASSDRPAGL